jgi:hypothetical protein
MKKSLSALLIVSGLVSNTFAANINVSMTNLTKGMNFTPLFIAAHPSSAVLFTSGSPASLSLQKLAEGGDQSGLVADFTAVSANIIENPAGGLLKPGKSTSTSIVTSKANTHLSIAAMMIPTNDGFVAMDSVVIPTKAGTYTYLLNAYDAGTEANNEILVPGAGAPGAVGIPANPDNNMGTGATGVTSVIEGYVHIHRGPIGDTNLTGGKSDLDSTVHRWLNPVARVTITVN